MNLEEYLNHFFPGPFDDEFLKEHFKAFGVYVSIESKKFLFKYDQIEVDWNNPISQYCRGAILYYNYGEGWKYISRPWNKFYNREEGRSGYFTDKDFEKLSGKKVVLKQKMDGSLLQCYFDPEINDFRASTLGSILTSNVNDFGFTFSDLFWKLYGEDKSRFVEGTTSLFELCTAYNRIVTEYPGDHVCYLGTYSNATGEFLEDLSEKIGAGLKTPIEIPFTYSSWNELDEFVEQSSKESIYGRNSEGWVCYHGGLPRFKSKNENYRNLHHLFTGDRVYMKKSVVNLFFLGKIDDVEKDLPEEMKKFKDRLFGTYLDVNFQIRYAEKEVKELTTNPKEYALKLQEIGKFHPYVKMFSAYFFEKRVREIEFLEWICAKNKNGKLNYESQMDFWKTL